MTSDAWVTIIATVLAALVTAIVTRFADIVNILRRPSRLIAGDWEGISYVHPTGVDDTWDKSSVPADIKYIVNLTQSGRQVNGIMTMTEAPSWVRVRKLNYTGKIVGDHCVYEASSTQPQELRLSTAILYVDTSGNEMNGFFVANGSGRESYRVFVGFTTMKRIGRVGSGKA